MQEQFSTDPTIDRIARALDRAVKIAVIATGAAFIAAELAKAAGLIA